MPPCWEDSRAAETRMISPGNGMPRLSRPMTRLTTAYTATAGTVSSHSWTCNATPSGSRPR